MNNKLLLLSNKFYKKAYLFGGMRKLALLGCITAMMGSPIQEIPLFSLTTVQEQAEHQLLMEAKEILLATKVKGALPSREWKIITLSQLAQGVANLGVCQHEEKTKCVNLLEEIVNESRVLQKKLTSSLPEDGLYLAHVNIILGSYQKVAQDDALQCLNKIISQQLVQWTLQDPQKHVRSYAYLKHKWPADQSAVLYSLFLYDQNYRTEISKKPIKEWLDFIHTQATNPELELPYSNITGKPHANTPRGCALSWSVMYISRFAPEEAQQLWLNYKKHFWEEGLLFSGFREWPSKENHGQDSDSGPIIYNIGASASAFGLAAAKLQKDSEIYSKLQHNKDLAQLLVSISPHINNAYHNPLARSLLFYVDTLN